jgi:large-conductance mechanosensitive channel
MHRLRTSDSDLSQQGNILSSIFEKFVLAMVAYFIVSIIHSLAQSYHKRKLKQIQEAEAHAS